MAWLPTIVGRVKYSAVTALMSKHRISNQRIESWLTKTLLAITVSEEYSENNEAIGRCRFIEDIRLEAFLMASVAFREETHFPK